MLLVIVLVQHGNAEKLGNKSSSEYKLSGDFAIITGQLSNGSATISYPNGFNKDNCVVISLHMKKTETNGWQTGTTLDASSYSGGAMPVRISLKDNIIIQTKNIQLTNGNASTVLDSTVTSNYKLVLMKAG